MHDHEHLLPQGVLVTVATTVLGLQVPDKLVSVALSVCAGLTISMGFELAKPTLQKWGRRISREPAPIPENAQPYVLVVEDDRDQRGLIGEELAGLSVVHAVDVAGGIRAIKGARPAVVLLDLGLPDSGTPQNVAQVMRAAFDGTIVVVSGHPAAKEIAGSIDAACVGKPCEDGAIESAVRFAIRASAAPHPPR